ncbi:MAG TPA: HK97 gp10 family phage protein [Desulfosporosinus sp.]|nr:HK97 gp10 family phage protein [Desulfosporosinus sp.]
MSSGGDFEITGLNELEQDLIKVIGKKFPMEAKKFLRKQANAVRKQARADTPKDSGYTRKHWKVFAKGKRMATANFIEAKVTNDGQLSHLLENGHNISNQYGKYGWQPGIHMLEKAVTKKEATFEADLNAFISDALRELSI